MPSLSPQPWLRVEAAQRFGQSAAEQKALSGKGQPHNQAAPKGAPAASGLSARRAPCRAGSTERYLHLHSASDPSGGRLAGREQEEGKEGRERTSATLGAARGHRSPPNPARAQICVAAHRPAHTHTHAETHTYTVLLHTEPVRPTPQTHGWAPRTHTALQTRLQLSVRMGTRKCQALPHTHTHTHTQAAPCPALALTVAHALQEVLEGFGQLARLQGESRRS